MKGMKFLLLMMIAMTASADDIAIFDASTSTLNVPVIAMQDGDKVRLFEADIRLTGERSCEVVRADEFYCGFSPVNYQCSYIKPK